ncbi:amidohydrolase family protein [Limibaculum sp. FT325]|uniref:amidohydrolase family protein n=1 Tax=Thermohalobaculum sediminis TaxID=2939436 RepID=UPI0020BFEE93|nr:amidohydrolase family protein [Limibaculum sediminis]MCL5777192.1 amidohydrolase family protein [Limibaculum sediminis]
MSGLDLVLRRARIAGRGDALADIGIAAGRIAAISPVIASDAPVEDLDGRIVVPGFVESHVHLDKSCLLERCGHAPTLAEAIGAVAAAKRGFTVEDVYSRGRATLEKAILHGTTRMRTHVEIDPRVGLRGFEAVRGLKADYAWAIELQICVFPQEGLLNDPGAEELLIEAIERGADLIGGCPYTDSDPHGHIARIFDIAGRHDLDIDFHLDFHLDPARGDLAEVCRQARARGWGGRVAVGHVTTLSALAPEALAAAERMMADAGVALTVLPSTDLFLMGRASTHLVPRGVAPAHRLAGRGVTCSISTNNVLNPFTPFGDCSLIRMANLYANVAQLGSLEEMRLCLDMVTAAPARLMNLADYGVEPGNPADLVVLDARAEGMAVAELAAPLFGLKAGRRTFTRPAAVLHAPGAARAGGAVSAA